MVCVAGPVLTECFVGLEKGDIRGAKVGIPHRYHMLTWTIGTEIFLDIRNTRQEKFVAIIQMG